MLVFRNKGLIPMAAVTTMGVNAKVGDNPIGQFGTGLKIAIAIVLRLGGTIEVWRGKKRNVFSKREKTIRGKTFNVITMNNVALGFTDHLGAHWQPWMAYRELASNCKDEGGTTQIWDPSDGEPEGVAGETLIVVNCKELSLAHYDRDKLFLRTEPEYVLNEIEVHSGESKFIFYRGIRVHELAQPSLYTYNLTGLWNLTEDRTLLHPILLEGHFCARFMKANAPTLLMNILSATKTKSHFEGSLRYNNNRSTEPTDTFLSVSEKLKDEKDLIGQVSMATNFWMDRLPGRVSPFAVEPTAEQEYRLNSAIERLRSVNIAVDRGSVVFKSNLEYSKVQNIGTIRILMDASLLDNERKLAHALVQGVALLKGGGVAEQLCSFIVDKEWIPSELTEGYAAAEEDIQF